jgi:hypothetical protein
VREDRLSKIRVKDFDLILPQASGSIEMKVPRVLIAKGNVFYFCALAPVGRLVIVLLAEVGFGERPKASLQQRENMVLLKAVEEGYDSSTILEVD